MQSRIKPVLKYPGAKWSIAPWIVSKMPEHKCYVEPWCGSCAVLFGKPLSRIETINDLNQDVVNLFETIRCYPHELACAVEMTPHSRTVYESAQKTTLDGLDNHIERARLFLIKLWMNQGSGMVYPGGWRHDIAGREYAYALREWNDIPRRILDIVERLKMVQIENRPALDVIKIYDRPNTLLYADPPYLMSTRSGRKQYAFEMSEADHIEMLEALRRFSGMVMLSGYDSDLYNDMLTGWNKYQTSARAQGGAARTETLWCNFAPLQMELKERMWNYGHY